MMALQLGLSRCLVAASCVFLVVGAVVLAPTPPSAAHQLVVGDDTPLARVPMIMTHDAGSGYLGKGLINRWAQTQSVGLGEQLACGARAFDARPTVSSNGTVVWHHGSVDVDYSFAQSVSDMVAWLAENPAELVLVLVWDCEGSGCLDHVASEAKAAGVTVVSDCSRIKGLSLGAAKKLGKLAGGGAMLVVTGGGGPNGAACATTHYDSSLACTAGVTGCWASDKGHEVQLSKMLKQLDGFISSGLSNTSFWQAQAMWQESPESVIIGTARNSSLLKDEVESQLNLELAKQVRAKRWPSLNLLEVNNVCDGGPELLKAIRDTYY